MPKAKAKPVSRYKRLKNYVLSKDILIALIVALTVILAGLSLGWYNNKVVPVNPAHIAHYNKEPQNHLSFISDWDGPDYIKLSLKGYTRVGKANFFPLYPILIHVVNKVVSSALYSALLISWASLVGALYFYLKIIKKLYKVPAQEAIRALLLFVLFPTGVFLIATYTESLFAFLALASIYYALNKRYLISVIFVLFATATHITGMFLLLFLVLILLEQGEKIWKIVAYAMVGSLGLATYMSYLLNRFNKPLAFITAQESHGWVHEGSSYFYTLENSFNVLNIFFLALLVLSVIYWWNKRKSFAIYSFCFLLIPLVGGQFGGFDRYALMAFPIQIMLYEKLKDKPMAYALVLVVFSITWAYTVMQYSGGYTGS